MNNSIIAFCLLLLLTGCSDSDYIDREKTQGPLLSIDDRDYWRSIPALDDDGLVNVVIEIPAGSNAKWEVNKQTGHLDWEVRDDTLRVVDYLPYPANYGMVPSTYLPVELGGDGDPLDVFVLGPRMEIGTIYPVRLVGVIKMIDDGENDDKIIAVDPNSWFYAIDTLEDLESNFEGITTIMLTWLENYKRGRVPVEISGVLDEKEAHSILHKSIEAYYEFIRIGS